MGLSIREADVVVEGKAVRVTDHDLVARVAKVWAEGGWPVEPAENGSTITAPFNAVAGTTTMERVSG